MSTLQVNTAQVTTLSDGTNSTSCTNAILGSAKAWVNFDGRTSPGTIKSSYNVSLVVKNGAGDYTIFFTNPFSDNNFTIASSIDERDPSYGHTIAIKNTLNSACQIGTRQSNNFAVTIDYTNICLTIFR